MNRSTAALRRLLAGGDATFASKSPARVFTSSGYRVDEEAEKLSFEGPGFYYGLNSALAGRGVLVKDKAYYNLDSSELRKNGAMTVEHIPGIPLFARGITDGGVSKMSRAQFSKLLKQVTNHLSSVSNIFVQDGAISSSPECDAKVRIISDNPSAVLSLSKILWKMTSRAISHDPCPLTVYIAASISPIVAEVLGSGSKGHNGFAAADIERSSLIICGKGFANATVTKDALAALAAPVLTARGGLPISARLLISGDSLVLLFAPEDTISRCSDLHKVLVSTEAGVVLSSSGAAAAFNQTGGSTASKLLKKPDSVVFITSDSTGVFPSVAKLSPGQAAYQFLAGFSDGKFMPAYIKGPSPLGPLELANSFHQQLKENEIPTFLINIGASRNHTGKELIKLVESSMASNNFPELKLKDANSRVVDLKGKYKTFLCGRFRDLPKYFYF